MVEEVKNGCIRVWSSTNEWIDCIFLVNQEDKEKAIEVLKKAWDAFWIEGESWCYGDFLEAKMSEAGISFDVYYADAKE